jgi:hypothetical protein
MQMPYEIEIPTKLIDHIRVYIGDMPEFNRLIEGVETGDEKLKLAIQLWIQYFNSIPPVLPTKYGAENFPNYLLLIHGVMIEVLKMSGIVQTRNFLNFNDGGVSFSVSDKGQEYLGWINNLLSTHAQDLINTKVGLNAEDAYDIHPSPDGHYRGYYY